MGKTTSGTARLVRGVRTATKPVKAVAHKASAFADKVSMDMAEQDRERDLARDRKTTRKNLLKVLRSVHKYTKNPSKPEAMSDKNWAALKSNKTIVTADGVSLTPFATPEDAPPLPDDLMLVSTVFQGETIYPGHVDYYIHEELGRVEATYHGTMPNGDIYCTLEKVES